MFKKNKAKIEILNFITQHSINEYSSKTFVGGYSNKPVEGDLVALQLAPNTNWYLSWYHTSDGNENSFCENHLLESIETGELCNWSNVSFNVMEREHVDNHPEWRWEDKQFEFCSKWYRATKKADIYPSRPMQPIFAGLKVTLKIRRNFSDVILAEKTFDNYKKVLSRDMIKFCVDNIK